MSIETIIKTLESINGEASSHRLAPFMRPDVTYQTPTHQSQKPEGVRDIIAFIFVGGTGRIRVTDHAAGQDGLTHYLRWDRQINAENNQQTIYSGITELMFATDGKIASLIDYYDPADAPAPPRGSFLSRIMGR